MQRFPIFLSVVFVLHDQADHLPSLCASTIEFISGICADYELIVVDNGSSDDSLTVLKELTATSGLANLQVFALTKQVDIDTASWVGLENALGDFVAVVNPLTDSVSFLPRMLEEASRGADVVFATNKAKPRQSLAYRTLHAAFNALHRRLNGFHLAREAPQFRVLSRRVVNFVLRHPASSVAYRHLPATAGFARSNLEYSQPPQAASPKPLWEGIDQGLRLLVSTTRAPMRIVTSLSLFGALANLVYSLYVIGVAIWKVDVAAGWVTLSLQQSGMFFLLSLVLLVLGEYMLHTASRAGEGPPYHVAQEFTSTVVTRLSRLNVEEARAAEVAEPRDTAASNRP